jgi:CRP/FNR family transcriptional regulator, cyclic AMP receptor protein
VSDDLGTLRTLEAGETLIVQGEASGVLYQLRSGALDVVRDGTVVARVTEPGAFVGEMSLLLERPPFASVVAQGTAVVAEVPDAMERFRAEPAFALGLARLLAHRLDTMNGYLADLTRQYADHDGGLGMIGDVLAALSVATVAEVEPGSEREDDAPY